MTYIPKVNALLRALLTDEYFGNGPPNWIVSRGKANARPSQTREGAIALRRAEARKLCWHANHANIPLANELTDILNKCRPGNRCFSGACPICHRALQRWYVDKGETINRQILRHGEQPVMLSMAPDYGQTPPDTLCEFDWVQFMTSTCRSLQEAGV
jgi:hypothetical protein